MFWLSELSNTTYGRLGNFICELGKHKKQVLSRKVEGDPLSSPITPVMHRGIAPRAAITAVIGARRRRILDHARDPRRDGLVQRSFPMDHARDAFFNSDEATTASITPVMEEEENSSTAVTLVFLIYEAITASITAVMEGVMPITPVIRALGWESIVTRLSRPVSRP